MASSARVLLQEIIVAQPATKPTASYETEHFNANSKIHFNVII
jgi:hypothetical protein